MSQINTFRAFLYHPANPSEWPELLSPPYDVIKEEDRKQMIKRNPHNSVRLCLVEDPNDSHRYEKMNNFYQSWKSENLLQQQERPAFYLIEDRFQQDSNEKVRIGFVGLLEIVDFEKKKVLPHEHTLAGPKKDRLELLKTMGAELSQIYMVYDDPDLALESVHKKLKATTPVVDCQDSTGVHRRMWCVENKEDIDSIKAAVEKSQLLIADGHHRYETALFYSKEFPSEKTKYVQTYFSNRRNPAFSILPIHRLFQIPTEWNSERILNQLKTKYQIETVTVLPDEIVPLQDEVKFVISFREDSTHWILSRKKSSETDAEIFSIQTDIFEGVFGWDISKISKGLIEFEHTKNDYLKTLNDIKNSMGIYLPSTNMDLIMQVVNEGRRMPQKSTFFYPKLASGLVIYELGNA